MGPKRPKKLNRDNSFSDLDADGRTPADNSMVDQEEIDDMNKSMTTKVAKEPITMNKVIVRSITATFLAMLYLSILYAGHFYCLLAVAVTQTQLYREIVNVRYVEARERSMPWFRTLQWSWFVVAMIYVYGETMHRFCLEHATMHRFLYITENFSSIVHVSYWIIFITSVLSLKPGLIRFQLSQHFWSIVTVCLVVFQCMYFPATTLNGGIFWYFFPMAMVIMNDVSAYFVGITVGRKLISAPFLALSPNKTWEGFIGAFLCTVVFSFFFSGFIAQFSWYVCPAETIQVWPILGQEPLSCTPHAVFIAKEYMLPIIGATRLYPVQWHGLAYGFFASIVAPFGGFFASAVKRAYKKKDFDSFMPGHGGMMDRMDCQLMMITFNSFYFNHFISTKTYGIDKLLLFVAALTREQQIELWNELGRKLGMSAEAICNA